MPGLSRKMLFLPDIVEKYSSRERMQEVIPPRDGSKTGQWQNYAVELSTRRAEKRKVGREHRAEGLSLSLTPPNTSHLPEGWHQPES